MSPERHEAIQSNAGATEAAIEQLANSAKELRARARRRPTPAARRGRRRSRWIKPLTDLGPPAVRAYAARAGQSEEEYLHQTGEPLTPEVAGTALVPLVRAGAATVAPGFMLTGAWLQKLP